MTRAVIESVAENTCDAVVAPLLWGAVAGLPGLAAYRAVNTLDAMVGYRSPRYLRFGWASARLDDAANWVPARVTAALDRRMRARGPSAGDIRPESAGRGTSCARAGPVGVANRPPGRREPPQPERRAMRSRIRRGPRRPPGRDEHLRRCRRGATRARGRP